MNPSHWTGRLELKTEGAGNHTGQMSRSSGLLTCPEARARARPVSAEAGTEQQWAKRGPSPRQHFTSVYFKNCL